MKPIVVILPGILVLFGAANAAVPKGPAAAPSLCVAGETRLFSCPIKGKLISICGGGGHATYRYGRPGRVELSSQGLVLASRGTSGGGETQISFAHEGYRYIVYDKTVRTGFSPGGGNDPEFTSGLIVRKGDRTVMSSQCATDAAIGNAAREAIPAGAFVDH